MKKKFAYGRSGIFITLMVGVCALLSAIFVIRYTESLFLVLIGWLLLPVLVAKLYSKLRRSR